MAILTRHCDRVGRASVDLNFEVSFTKQNSYFSSFRASTYSLVTAHVPKLQGINVATIDTGF